MKHAIVTALYAAGAICAATYAATADEATEKAIKARKAQMQLYSWNLGTLGAMAKGATEYNADAANAAAANLVALVSMSQQGFWPQGSDSTSMAGKTRAKSEIWSTYPEVSKKGEAMNAAVTTLAAVAGDGLPALQGAIGDVGKSCGGCHKPYREEQ